MNNFFWYLLFDAANWIPTSLAYGFMLGRGRILNWGPIGISLIAAYATFTTLMATGSYAVAIPVGLVVTSAVSLFYAWLSLRLPGDSFGVMSIAVHLAFLAVVLNWPSLTRGSLGIPGIPWIFGVNQLWVLALMMIGVAAAWAILIWRLDKSAFGRQLRALGEQEWQAVSLGIGRPALYYMTFLLLGFGLWTSTFFFTQYLHFLHPNDFSFSFFIFLLTMVVAGRPGSIRGVIISTIFLIFLRDGVRFINLPSDIVGPARLILFGVILYVAVWVRRDSLFPRERSI